MQDAGCGVCTVYRRAFRVSDPVPGPRSHVVSRMHEVIKAPHQTSRLHRAILGLQLHGARLVFIPIVLHESYQGLDM